MSEHYSWPAKVRQVTSMAPGEIRLLTKASGGQALADMDPADQLKASVFIGLLRDWQAHHIGDMPDPAEVWEKAEWTEIELETGGGVGVLNPPSAAG